jgi:hypothetical protein
VFDEQLRGLSVQRHSINRRLVFVFLLQDAKEFVVAQPKRVPNEIILARNTNCFFAGEIEFLDRRLRSVPVFTLMLGAAIDIHQQRLTIRETLNRSLPFMPASVSTLDSAHFLRTFPPEIDVIKIV